MNIDNIYSLLARLFFIGALALFAVVIAEVVMNVLNYTILPGAYTTPRLLEGIVVLLVFVISILLRQVRDALREKG